MYNKILLFIFIFSFIGINVVYSQPSQYWIKYFTNGELDYTRDLSRDKNGNYIVTGTSVVSYPGFSNYGVVTIKYDSLGNQKWVKTKDNPNSITDDPYQILLDDSSNIYVFGIMAGECFLLKYNESGEEKWYTEFNSLFNYNEFTDKACIDNEANIYCTGSTEVNGRLQSFIRKYSSDGILLWHKNFDSLSTNADYPASIIFDNHEHLFLTGCSITSDSTNFHYILKLDKDGNISWQSLFGTDSTRSFKEQIKLIISGDGELYLLGTKSSIYPGYGRDIEIIKVDSSGNQIWENHLSGYEEFDDYPRDIIVDNNKSVYVTGSITAFYPPNMVSNLFATAKFSASGDSLWCKILGQNGNYPGIGVVLNTDENNNLYVAGGLSVEPFVAGNYDMMILKYNSEGDTIWTLRRNIYNIDNTPADLLLNATDDFTIILAGALRYVTIRYSDNIVDVASESPIDKFELRQNYPNPFNPNTTINYSIPEASNIKIELYDILGNKIQLLVNEYKSAGKHSVEFNGSQLSSGIYLYRLITDNFIQSKKMMLLK